METRQYYYRERVMAGSASGDSRVDGLIVDGGKASELGLSLGLLGFSMPASYVLCSSNANNAMIMAVSLSLSLSLERIACEVSEILLKCLGR